MGTEIEKEIHDYIVEQFLPGEDPDSLKKETPLMSGGILDSIAVLKMVTFLEENYGIKVEAHEVSQENFETVDNIAGLVNKKLSEKK